MPLANYDINQQLTALTTTYFNQNVVPFAELKKHLISKSPIPFIQTQISQLILDSRDSEKTQIQTYLEQSAYQNQIDEDEREKKRDLNEEQEDSTRKDTLVAQLKQLELERNLAEIRLLAAQAAVVHQHSSEPVVHQHSSEPVVHQHSSEPVVHQHSSEPVVHQHSSEPVVHQHSSEPVVHQHSSEPIVHHHPHSAPNIHLHQDSINVVGQLQTQILMLTSRINAINQELHAIEDRAKSRASRRDMRETRLQARIDYTNKKGDVDATLSPFNAKALRASICTQHDTLNDLCSALIKKAAQLNYAVFLKQTELHLAQAKHTTQEIDALRKIIRLMNLHFAKENEKTNKQSSLNNINNTIATDRYSLSQQKAKLVALKSANPTLVSINKDLAAENITLQASIDSNIKSRSKLITPSIILASLFGLSTIPLILTLAGIIPATALLLLASPPALFLVATIGVGIAALVYTIMANSNSATIKKNQNTIGNNEDSMRENLKDMSILESDTIPGIEKMIGNSERTRDQLTSSLQVLQKDSESALHDAQVTEPAATSLYSSASSTFFVVASNQNMTLQYVEEERIANAI